MNFFAKWIAAGMCLALGTFGTAFALTTLKNPIKADGMWQGDLYTYLSNVKTKIDDIDASVDSLVTLATELRTDHATNIAVIADNKALVNDIRTQLQGDAMLGVGACAAGSTTTDVATGAFDYIVNGVMYTKAAVADGTALGDTDTTDNGEVAGYAFDIGADGTIDAIAAADNAGGDYADASAALAAIPAVASDHVRICTVTVEATTGTFVAGTDDVDDGNVTTIFTDSGSAFTAIAAAVSTSPAATITAAAPTAIADTDTLSLTP